MSQVPQGTAVAFGQQLTDANAEKVIGEITAFVRVLATSPRLAKALADPDTPVESKRSLVENVSSNQLDAVTVDGIVELASSFQRSQTSLVQWATDWVADVVFAVADRRGNLAAVETQLYDFADLIELNPSLRDAFTNPGVEDAAKFALIDELLNGKADSSVVALVRVLVSLDHGRGVDESAAELSRKAAAYRNMVVAHVTTAIELDAERKARLSEALSQSTGKSVQPRFYVDPNLVGSVVVRIGDEVLDGSIRHRLNQARVAISGAR